MKTWEMIKELTENPGKKFRSIHSDQSTAHTLAVIRSGGILFKNRLGDSTALYYIGLDWVWEEAKEPVDFMTAFKAFREGKTIYSLRSDCNYKPHYVPSDDYFNKFHEEDIASDKWYIKD